MGVAPSPTVYFPFNISPTISQDVAEPSTQKNEQKVHKKVVGR